MVKHRLTDRKLKALRRKAQRYDLMDADVPGFGVRVSEAGQKTFILLAAIQEAQTQHAEP
jgi:hypothetical protein